MCWEIKGGYIAQRKYEQVICKSQICKGVAFQGLKSKELMDMDSFSCVFLECKHYSRQGL